MMQPAPVPQMSMDPHQQQPSQMGAQLPQQQQWMMQPPQYQQAPPPPAMWGQQPPPAQVQMAPPQMQTHQQQMQPQQMQQMQQQQQQQQYVQQLQQPASADEVRTLWIGDLQYWMDESYIYGCFSQSGEVSSVKVIRNKQSGQSEGYGFIEFANRAAAERTLQAYNGALMPNVEQSYRLNWASFGVGEKRPESGPDFPIFVGDLASDVSDYILQETFRGRFSSVKGAKVVTDRVTGRSKGYGFVRFGDEGEQIRAMTEMNGVFCSTRPMRIGPATTKKTLGTGIGTGTQQTKAPYQASSHSSQAENDPNNTTIFVGGLDPSVGDDLLKQVFGQYGELVHVKIPLGKRCGFVQFANRANAEEALGRLNGTLLGQQSVRLSWGRSPSNKQESSAGWSSQPQQADPNQWNGGYYGYSGQGYENYGYSAAAAAASATPQDPNMYAYGGYPGYQNYPTQQQ